MRRRMSARLIFNYLLLASIFPMVINGYGYVWAAIWLAGEAADTVSLYYPSKEKKSPPG